MGYYGGGYDYGGGYGGDFGDAYEDDARFSGASGGDRGDPDPVPQVDSHAGREVGGDNEGNGEGGIPKVASDASDEGGQREVAAGGGKEEPKPPEAAEPKKVAPFKVWALSRRVIHYVCVRS